MLKNAKYIIPKESLEDIVAGVSENKVCYWIKTWINSKFQKKIRSIISEFPKGVKPLPYSEGNFEIKFVGPYETREEALNAMS